MEGAVVGGYASGEVVLLFTILGYLAALCASMYSVGSDS